MRWVFSAIFLACTSVYANPETSLQESLDLRRIAEYWKEKEYNSVKIQIREFLNKHPESPYTDQLYAMMGDLYFKEKNFIEASLTYEKIQGEEFQRKCAFQRLHAYYESGKYDALIADAPQFFKGGADDDQVCTIRFELAEAYYVKAHEGQNKEELLQSALSEYQQLMSTKYCDQTLMPQATIYSFFEDYRRAADFYLALAQKDPEKKEEYLFQAAACQLHFDKNAAIQTFGALCEMNGKYVSQAAFNQLNLLFQEKRYRDFILAQDKVLKYVPKEKLSFVHYALGKSLFQVGDFSRAIDPFSQSLLSKELDRPQVKNALLSLLVCAKEVQDLILFEKALSLLKAEFPQDDEVANSLLMHSEICRSKKLWGKAREDIKEILEIFPRHSQREPLLYDLALTFSQEEKWQESAAAFEVFLQEFPHTRHRETGLRHIVRCRLEDVKRASRETERTKKEQLASALSSALEEKKVFSRDEKQKMRFLHGKTLFELGQYDEASVLLSEYIRDYQKDATCADAYLLLAYACQKENRSDLQFALNAEKALSLNPKLSGVLDLHLTLYNTYLSLARESDEKAEMMEKAAEHLFLALDKPASKENQKWLANYYFQHGNKERAATVLEKLLEFKTGEIVITLETLDREGEAMKLAEVYGKMGRLVNRTQLLEALVEEQRRKPEFHWKFQRMAQFELGKTYLTLGLRDKARTTFDNLIQTSSTVSSFYALAAQVEKAKLDFSLLKDEDKREDAFAAMEICDQLKNVELKRKLHSEPLHLEAALEYINIKSELAKVDQRKERTCFLLEQMKESFSTDGEYFDAAGQFPEKERLCRQYLDYVDAEILRIQGETQRSDAMIREAKDQLDKLMAESTHEALTERISKSREKL